MTDENTITLKPLYGKYVHMFHETYEGGALEFRFFPFCICGCPHWLKILHDGVHVGVTTDLQVDWKLDPRDISCR